MTDAVSGTTTPPAVSGLVLLPGDPFEEEDFVRVTQRSVCGDRDIDQQAAAPGEYVVHAFVPPGEGDDPEGRPYYLLDVYDMSFGGCHWAYPEHVQPSALNEDVAFLPLHVLLSDEGKALGLMDRLAHKPFG